MKLKKRARVDGVRNEVRAPGKAVGKFVYLGFVAAFVFWVFNLFFGQLFFFSADGLVVRDRVVVATQYDASVDALAVSEGSAVRAGTRLATLRSQAVEEKIADLSAEVARLLDRASSLEVRREVIEATRALSEQRVQAARAARQEMESKSDHFTRRDRMLRLQDELMSLEARHTDLAEYGVIQADLPELQAAIEAAKKALARLQASYADGEVSAPVDGVVGYLHVSPGSVVGAATEMMEIYTGRPYVLAYVPEGALYRLHPGIEVDVEVGLQSYAGTVREIYPVSASLPKEYVDALRVPQRAPLARIDLKPGQPLPTLFARTEVTASGWLPLWLVSLLGTAEAAPVAAEASAEAKLHPVPRIEPQIELHIAAQTAAHTHAQTQAQIQVSEPSARKAGFTLQLVALADRARAEAHAQALGLKSWRVVPQRASDGEVFALQVGAYETRAQADAAASQLGLSDAWIRSR